MQDVFSMNAVVLYIAPHIEHPLPLHFDMLSLPLTTWGYMAILQSAKISFLRKFV